MILGDAGRRVPRRRRHPHGSEHRAGRDDRGLPGDRRRRRRAVERLPRSAGADWTTARARRRALPHVRSGHLRDRRRRELPRPDLGRQRRLSSTGRMPTPQGAHLGRQLAGSRAAVRRAARLLHAALRRASCRCSATRNGPTDCVLRGSLAAGRLIGFHLADEGRRLVGAVVHGQSADVAVELEELIRRRGRRRRPGHGSCDDEPAAGRRGCRNLGRRQARSVRRMTAVDPARLTIDTIRTLAMDAVQQANAGHPGTAMALAPLAYLLYREVMHHNPANPHWPDRDRFVLSAGHACILQYAALHLVGLRPLARGAEALPPVGVAHAGPPRGAPHAGNRGDDRPARPGLRERRRLRDRRALPRRALQPPATTRSSTTASTRSAPTAT